MKRDIEQTKVFRWAKNCLIVLVPIMLLALSFNLVVRSHDVSNWYLTKQDAMTECQMDYKSEDMSTQIAKYLLGTTDKLVTYYEDSENYDYVKNAPEFTENDYSNLDKIKLVSNIFFAFFVLSFLCVAAVFYLMIRNGYDSKSELRKKMIEGLIIAGGVQLIIALLSHIGILRRFVLGKLIMLSTGTGDLLPKLYGTYFPCYLAWAILLLTLIIGIVIFYVTWVCTKPRNIFNDRRYFQ